MSTRQVLKYRVCDRCKSEREAETTHKFGLDGYVFEIDLCSDHSAELYGQLMGWGDHGTLKSEPTIFDRARPVKAVVINREPAPVVALPRTDVDDYATEWHVTKHAEERAHERNVHVDAMLRAAQRPQSVTPSSRIVGASVRERDGVAAVVKGHRILTTYSTVNEDQLTRG